MRKNLLFLLSVLLGGMALTSCTAKPTQLSQTSPYGTQEWIAVEDYDIFVHEFTEEQGVIDNQRLVFIEVAYANNRSAEELSCRRNQWYLYDNQGYSYEAESSPDLYANKNVQYLGGERLLSQNMQLRGWLAFKVPANTTITRIQFMMDFLNSETADIMVEGLE